MGQSSIPEPLIAEPTTTATGGKPYTAPQSQVWGWGVGKVAEFGLVAMFGQAVNIFTVGFGLSPVIVGWCMMLPRLVDGIVDPMIGHWSDETHTRWGRRKPFMLAGALAGACFLSILWWASPRWNSTAQFVYLGVVGCFLYLCYGTYTMAWNAIGYELSDDYHERSRIQAVSGFFVAAMSLLFSWVYWLALRPMFGGVVWGMRWIGGGVAVLIVVTALVAIFTARERFTHTNRTHVALLPAIRTTITNRPFVILIIMKLFEIFGGRLTGGLAFFLSVYYVSRGDQNLGTQIGGIGATLGTLWSFAILPLVKPVSKWIGKRGALMAGAGLSFVAAMLSPFITTPLYPYAGLIPGLVLSPVIAISAIIAGAILPDICDVDELETGQRREGLFTSVMAFVSKIEISLAVVLVGYVVSYSGVDTTIATRWGDAVAGKSTVPGSFAAGERAVFSFKDAQAATFDSFALRGDVGTVELFAGDESPTKGFRSLGKFQAHDADPATPKEWKFAPVMAKYFKVELAPGDNSARKTTVQEVRLNNASAAQNLLAPENGGKVAAAEPPYQIGRRLYWLVMIPSIIFTGLTFLMTILFPLTEEKMKVVRQKLDEIRFAKAAAGEPTDEVAEEFVHEHPRQTAKFVLEHPEIVEEIKAEQPPKPSGGGSEQL
jgi:GPH family glycoside/pentoside/hexuronide:cation symporter